MRTRTTLTIQIALLFFLTVKAQAPLFQPDKKATTPIGQAMIECIYKYTTVTPIDSSISRPESRHPITAVITPLGEVDEYLTILQCNTSLSKFWDYNHFVKDSSIYGASAKLSLDAIKRLDAKYNLKIRHLFVSEIFKNFPKGSISVTDEIAPNKYLYEEPKRQYDWKLTDDTLTVNGYLCHKAITHLSGRV